MSGSIELFYIPNVTGDQVVLENEQFKHAVKALRKRQGDTIHFTDGEGVIYEGEMHDIDKRHANVIIRHRREVVPPQYNVSVCVSLTKNIKRIEWALEKIAEMGISRITPVICHRSERTSFNRDRIAKILVSAIKQSQQAFLPVLDDPMNFKEAISRYIDSHDMKENPVSTNSRPSDGNVAGLCKYIAYKSDVSISLKDNYSRGSDVVLFIGPEGDFTNEELEFAGKANFTALSLGNNRLRTETAAVVAVASVHAMNN